VDVAWKFFQELKAQGRMLDDVSYTSMIWVLCKAGRLGESGELFNQMEAERSVPCAYAYNTMC
jgi:pentatricopeptide repeat protein